MNNNILIFIFKQIGCDIILFFIFIILKKLIYILLS